MSAKRVIFINQFPSGTTIKIKHLVKDRVGCYEEKISTFSVTRLADLKHNDFCVYGVCIDGVEDTSVSPEERSIGAYHQIVDQLLNIMDLPYGDDNIDNIYAKAVEAGVIVPGTGPLIKMPASFCYQHFPKGTLFRVSPNGVDSYDTIRKDKVFEADTIFCNGPGSFVIETTTPASEIYGRFADMGFKYSTNVDNVCEIIKRGEGTVVFDKRGTCSSSELLLPVDLRPGTHKRRTNYVHFNEFGIIREASSKVPLPIGSILDMEAFSQALKKQTFFKKNWYARMANRKRTDRWVKQNINRFLMTITEARKQEQEFYANMHNNDYGD